MHEGVRLGVDAEEHELEAEDGGGAADEHEVEVDVEAAQPDRAGEQSQLEGEAEQEQDQAGDEEEARRAEQQELPRDSPAIADAAAVAAGGARLEGRGDLDRGEPGACGLDEHLAGELHPDGAEAEPLQRIAAERADAAADVGDLEAEEEAREVRLHGLEEVAVQRAHGAGEDAAVAARAEHQVVAGAQRLDEAVQFGEVVGAVAIDEEDELAAGGLEAAQAGGAVAADRLVHDDGAGARGAFGGAVARAIVGDDDLTPVAVAHERGRGVDDARADRLRLIEAGDHDRDGGRGVRPGHGRAPARRCARRRSRWRSRPGPVRRRPARGRASPERGHRRCAAATSP